MGFFQNLFGARQPAKPFIRPRWQLGAKEVFRFDEFAGVPTSGATTSLRLAVSADRELSGTLSLRLLFELKPYLYLIPDRTIVEEAGVFFRPPFAAAIWSDEAGAGTDASPLFLGAPFGVYAYAIEDDPEMVHLGNDNTQTALQCARAIGNGAPFSFTLYNEKVSPPLKVRFDLDNDREFAVLFDRLIGSL
jgi:hypothetical protein